MRKAAFLAGVLMMTTNCGANASEPDWQATAEAANRLAPGQLDTAREQIANLSDEDRTAVEKALTDLASVPRTLEGVEQAFTKHADSVKALYTAEGPTPAGNAFRQAGRSVVQGIVFQTGQAVASEHPDQATALIELVRTGDVRMGDGTATILVREVRMGLGPELYIQSLPKKD